MKSSMKIFLLFIAIVGIILGLIHAVTSVGSPENLSSEEPPPEQVAVLYCELSERGDFAALADITTDYPDSYFEAKAREAELDRIQRGLPPVQKEIDCHNCLRESTTPEPRPQPPANFASKELSRLVNRNAEFVRSIESVSIRNDQARVRARIGSRLSERYSGIQDFLLHKENGKWKIFLYESPAVFNVYGGPDS